MRTQEVEDALRFRAHSRATEVLAAEVERLETDAKAMTIMLRGRGELLKRAEAAEARVRELEAQYACKRHNGEEAPEAAAQLTDDMLRSCQICGLTVDISKGHCEPTIEFTMQGRTDKKTKKLAELEAQNARMRAALEDIAAYDVGSRHAGTCPYGCDTPAIAQNTLAAEAGRARAATKALADGKAAP
jgi:hypothetical protein